MRDSPNFREPKSRVSTFYNWEHYFIIWLGKNKTKQKDLFIWFMVKPEAHDINLMTTYAKKSSVLVRIVWDLRVLKTFYANQLVTLFFIRLRDPWWSLDCHSQRVKSDQKEKRLRSSHIKSMWDKNDLISYILGSFFIINMISIY